MFISMLISFLLLPSINNPFVDKVTWKKKDAVVWSVDQEIQAIVNGNGNGTLWLFHNGNPTPINYSNGVVDLKIRLDEIENHLFIAQTKKGKNVVSDTLKLTLGYKPVPIIKPETSFSNNQLTITATILENPLSEKPAIQWKSAPENPENLELIKAGDQLGTFKLPSKDGDYWIELHSKSKHGIKVYKAMFRKQNQDFIVFGADNMEHPWMNHAILYQLSPYNFTEEGGLDAITEKLDDIASLGINTLYLQPIFLNSRKGQGYDIVNYFKLNPKYGAEENLRWLISKANGLGMKVLFDLVINHSSIHHPYAKDRIQHGKLSHYDDFYHTKFDGAKYSSNYNADEYGFINYFWKDLVNLNYDNEEVQRWMLEACKYWVEAFGIDGYRFDAIWGVMARKPEFGHRLRNELKSIKPDILMLAEAKGRESDVYENGYDAAYDWTSDTLWVSQWSWEYEYNEAENKTAFNHPINEKRVEILKEAIFDNPEYADRILRFTENNDLPRFPVDHGLERSKLASSLVFSLPGIPMLYQGQEIGALSHPYTSKPVFTRENSITSKGDPNLFGFYQNLIQKRKQNPAFFEGELIPLDQFDSIVGFWRKSKNQEILVLMNPGDTAIEIDLQKDQTFKTKNSPATEWVDLLHETTFSGHELSEKIKLDSYQIIWLTVKGIE